MIQDPRTTRARRTGWLLLACLLLPAARCRPEPPRDTVVVSIAPDGATRIVVTSLLARDGEDPEERGNEVARDAVDDYLRGRDPWLRGFERAGATQIEHHLIGSDAAPEGIERQASIESAAALVRLMPDAIANVSVAEDPGRGVTAIRIIHIDRPAFLRDNQRVLAIAIDRLAARWTPALERTCDVYDYLAGHPERATALSQSLRGDEGPGAADLSPREEALSRRYRETWHEVDALWGDEDEEAMQSLLSARFAPFDEDLCFELPRAAVASTGFETVEDPELPLRYCAEARSLLDVMLAARPFSDPPMGLGSLVEEGAAVEEATFRCERYRDAHETARALWAPIEPLPLYELAWPTTAASE